MNIPTVDRGTYLIIRVGDTLATAELVRKKPSLQRIHEAIKPPQGLDFVCLSKGKDGQAETVMGVDDVGLLDNKPRNELASLLYGGDIRGDVVICRDEDFE
jgi:hypothetical protein